MEIDYCLITAAGLGTRMGEIGKILPKILWPIFETTLLDLQCQFAQRMGAKKIFLNGHFLSNTVRQYIEEKQLPITFVHEEVLLDVGGAIYNIANLSEVGHQGNLLVLNGDQFLFFESSLFDQALAQLEKFEGVLFGISVPGGAGYRETVIENGQLVDIRAAHHQTACYQTYSGVSLFNLSKIEKKSGVQPFFESIANYRQRKIAFYPLDNYSYWDFGTVTRYGQSLYSCVQDLNSPMAKFLDLTEGWQRQHLGEQSYCGPKGVLNFSGSTFSTLTAAPAIILAATKEELARMTESGIYYHSLRVDMPADSSPLG